MQHPPNAMTSNGMHAATLLALLALLALPVAAQETEPLRRVPWTTSRITGSPDRPPPFTTARAFPSLTFAKPVHLVPFPDHSRYVVVEERGRLLTFRNDAGVAAFDLLIDLAKEIAPVDGHTPMRSYAFQFDPDFERNRRCYVMYVLTNPPGKRGGGWDRGSVVSAFTMTRDDPPRLDPASEIQLVRWWSGGHNGCDLQFGNDGMLYISAGDAEVPNPPDPRRFGQDVSTFMSSILRIDVRNCSRERPYVVPEDNPFVDLEGARPEIWCYGLRNPWRMSFDRSTGRLWIADVGWERWEMIFCGEPGANFGWSIMEGPTPCLPDAKRGPTPIVPAAHSLPHPESMSVTGGFVARSGPLKGQYVYGDWETRLMWANPVDGKKLGDRRVIARTPFRIIAFAEEKDDGLLILDHDKGGIHRLVPREPAPFPHPFPRWLGMTGLFTSTKDQRPSPGVTPYEINAAMYEEGATSERWLAIPGTGAALVPHMNAVWPKDSVLAKTLTLDGRRVETQVLHYDGAFWNGYAYAWNREQTDATLVPATGTELDLGDGRTWTIQPRVACMTCHNPRAGYVLGLEGAQLNRTVTMGGREVGQFDALKRLGLLEAKFKKAPPLQDGARAYLSVNCSHCHRRGGGASSRIDLRHDVPLGKTHAFATAPVLGPMGLDDPTILGEGDPARSVLLYRFAKLGQGRMPHLGAKTVDVGALRMLADWVKTLPPRPGFRESAARRAKVADVDVLLETPTGALDLLLRLDGMEEARRKAVVKKALALPPGPVRALYERFEPESTRRRVLGSVIRPAEILALPGDVARGRALFESSGLRCAQCHGKDTMGPDLAGVGTRLKPPEILESLLDPSGRIDPKYAGMLVALGNGGVFNGVLVSESDSGIVLRNTLANIPIPRKEIRRMTTMKASLMPEGQLQHLTAREAADLLAYLASLR